MFLALAVVVISLFVWFDRDDRNPFLAVRVWKLIALIAMILALLMAHKSVQWNRDLRALVLSVCGK